MEKEYPWHLKQSESAWLPGQPGTTHKETAGWTFGLARSDHFAGEAGYQPGKCFKQPFLTGVSYWGKGSRNRETLANLHGSPRKSGRETEPSLSNRWVICSASMGSDRWTLVLQVTWVLYGAGIIRVRLRWTQLWWKRSEVPDPWKWGILPVLPNGLSCRKAGGFPGLAGICKPEQSYWSHLLKGWWKRRIKW